MATADTNLKTKDTTGNLLSLADIFLGKTTSVSSNGSLSQVTDSGGTTTTSKSVSPEGAIALANQLLTENGGLGSVAQGARTSGLYNSSTSKLLANDLLSRIAGQVASRNETTVQTTPQTTQTKSTTPSTQTTRLNPRVDPSATLAGLLALQAMPQEWKDKLKGLVPGIEKGTSAGTGSVVNPTPADDGTTAGIQEVIDSSAQNTVAPEIGAATSATSDALSAAAGVGAANDLTAAADLASVGEGAATAADTIAGVGAVGDLGAGIDAASGLVETGSEFGLEDLLASFFF